MVSAIMDVNVFFSALGGSTASFPMRAMAMTVRPDGKLVTSEELLGEVTDVLFRPRARERHQLSDAELSDFLSNVRSVSTLIDPEPGPPCPDPNDQHLWDLLATVKDAILVTGERALLESDHFPGRVLSPRQFVERYANDWPPSGEPDR